MAAEAGANFNSETEDKQQDEPVIVFQCTGCFRILGDSISWISSNADMHTISLSMVTDTLQIGKTMKISDSGLDAGSTYVLLRCSGCKADLGKVYKSTVRGLDDIRGLYTLKVDSLSSYQLSNPTDGVAIEDHQKYSNDSKAMYEQIVKLQSVCVHLSHRLSVIENQLGIQSDMEGQ